MSVCVSCKGNAVQRSKTKVSKSFRNLIVKVQCMDCLSVIPKHVKNWAPRKLQVDSLLYHTQCAHTRTSASRKTVKEQNETLQIMIPCYYKSILESFGGHLWISLESFASFGVKNVQLAAHGRCGSFPSGCDQKSQGPKVQCSDHDG